MPNQKCVVKLDSIAEIQKIKIKNKNKTLKFLSMVGFLPPHRDSSNLECGLSVVCLWIVAKWCNEASSNATQ